MTYVPGNYKGPGDYGPRSFTELFLGTFALVTILAGLWLLFHLFLHSPLLLASVGTLLMGVVAGPWPGEILASLGLGVVAGIIVGVVRLRYTAKPVLEELVGAVVSAETFTAATVRWSAVLFTVAIGVGSGLVVARLGTVGVGADVASVAGSLLSAGCYRGCPPGSGPGDLTVALFAIALVVVALTVLCSIGATALFAAVGKGLVTGGAQGAGKAAGIALVVFLTRLRTTGLTHMTWYSKPGRLTIEAACGIFIESAKVGSDAAQRRRIVEPYLAWLRSGISPGAGTRGDVEIYIAQSASRGLARWAARLERDVLQALIYEVPRIVSERDPVNRMTTTDGAPVFDGSNATLFHAEWFRRALLAGIREGALVGMVSAVLTLVLLLVGR